MNIAICGSVHIGALSDHLTETGTLTELMRPADSTPGTQLVRELLDLGHTVGVAMLDPEVRSPEVASGPRLTIRVGPERAQGRGRDAFRQERQILIDAIAMLDPDVVHAQWTYEHALAALGSGRPTVVTMRDWAPSVLRLFPDPFRVVRFGMNVVVVARSQALVVTSPVMAARLGRIRRRGVHLIPNGLLDEEIADQPRDVQNDPPRIVSISNGFSRFKNTSTLLQAMPLVRREHPEVVLEMIGVGHGEGGEAARWAAEHNLLDGVVFSGPVPRDEARRALDGADILAHPGRDESFGMVVVEAMGRGVPVVAGQRSGAVPWLLDEGRSGVLVDVEQPDAIAAGILGLLQDPQRWHRLSAAGWRRAGDTFRLRNSVAAYVELYRDAVQQEIRR